MTQKQRDIKRRLGVLEYAKQSGNVAKTSAASIDPTIASASTSTPA